MTKLYMLDVAGFDRQRILPLLPAKRQEKAEKLRKEADKNRSAAAGWLLQYALEQAGIPVREQVITETELGKPFLQGRDNLHFSLSHSGQLVVCAVSDRPVGVDVELPRCTPELARRCFRPEELVHLPVPEETALQRLWVAKEAFGKALGLGLTAPRDGFMIRLERNDAILEQNLSPVSYRLWEYTLGQYRICLCTPDDRPQLEEIKEHP